MTFDRRLVEPGSALKAENTLIRQAFRKIPRRLSTNGATSRGGLLPFTDPVRPQRISIAGASASTVWARRQHRRAGTAAFDPGAISRPCAKASELGPVKDRATLRCPPPKKIKNYLLDVVATKFVISRFRVGQPLPLFPR